MKTPLEAAAYLRLRLIAKRFNAAALSFAAACGKAAKQFERFAKVTDREDE